MFRNNHDGTFTESALTLGLAYDDDGKTFAGMGIDFADYDNDGWPDVFINALANQRYALFRNEKGHSFDYVTGPSGVAHITMLHSGWGARFIDYDNDGWKDLFVGQGHVMDNVELTEPSVKYREPLLLMRNRAGKFDNVSAQSGAPFQQPLAARGVAFGDLNNDGFVDIAINCNDAPALVLLNQGGNGNHWLLVNTVGSAATGMGSAQVCGWSPNPAWNNTVTSVPPEAISPPATSACTSAWDGTEWCDSSKSLGPVARCSVWKSFPLTRF